jgi:nicotinate phosphoribosyltransferase
VRLAREGVVVQAVRLDSGDLDALSRAVRATLDAGGLRDVRILASGNLDEHGIAALVGAGAPIDAFGVGTRLDASVDAPTLDAVYKLEEYDGRARRKRSAAKSTWPGRKQVWRQRGPDGRIVADTVGLEDEHAPGTPLLTRVMAGGRRLGAPEPLDALQARARASLAQLPDGARSLGSPVPLVAAISDRVRELALDVDRTTHG